MVTYKKGQSQYISWILIFAMIVAISFVLYNCSIEQAKATSEQLEASADPLTCSGISITVAGACQTFRKIELNVTNTNKVEIDGVLLRTVALYPDDPNYLDTTSVFIKIKPSDTEIISALKKGTLSQVKVIPFVKKDKKYVYCEDNSVIKEVNELKQC